MSTPSPSESSLEQRKITEKTLPSSKRCPVCCLTKPITDYYRMKGKPHRVHHMCKPCNRELHKKNYKKLQERTTVEERTASKRKYYVKLWDAWKFGGNREKAIQRDGKKCVRCGISRQEHKEKYGRDITVDHIDGLGCRVPKYLKNNDLSNLQTLCLACHGKKEMSLLHGKDYLNEPMHKS